MLGPHPARPTARCWRGSVDHQTLRTKLVPRQALIFTLAIPFTRDGFLHLWPGCVLCAVYRRSYPWFAHQRRIASRRSEAASILEIAAAAPGNLVFPICKHLTIRETAAVENPDIFWPLLDSLSQPELGTYATEKEYYERVLQLLGDEFLSDPVTLGSFELGLSLHTAAPKIEAYYQFYNTSVVPSLGGKYHNSCETWVYWRGEQICSPDGLESILRRPNADQR